MIYTGKRKNKPVHRLNSRADKRTLILVSLLVQLSLTIYGQTGQKFLTNVRFLGVNNGLSHREVYSITPDQDGLIWLGTRVGLDRFNGNKFEHFDFPVELDCRNRIHDSFVDGQSVLWLISYHDNRNKHAIACVKFFDLHQKKYLSWESYLGRELGCSFSDIHRIQKTADDSIVLWTNKGESLHLQWEGGQWYCDVLAESIEGGLIAANNNSLLLWQKKGPDVHELIRQFFDGNQETLLDSVKTELRSNFKFTAASSEFFIMEKQPKKLNFYQTKKGYKWAQIYNSSSALNCDPEVFWKNKLSLFVDAKRNLLFASSGTQILAVHYEEGFAKMLDFKTPIPEDLDVYQFRVDDLGNIWGATEAGLYLIQYKGSPFVRYLYDENFSNNYQGAYSCRGLLLEGDQLIVNTYRGQYQIDLRNQNRDTLAFASLSSKEVFYPLALGAAGSRLQALGNLQIKYPGIPEWETIPFADSLAVENLVWAMTRDRKGDWWMGMEKGLAKWSKGDSLIRFWIPQSEELDRLLKETTIYQFFPYGKERYLLATNHGILEFDIQDGIVDQFHNKGTGVNYLPYNEYFHIHQSKDSTIWLASNGGGLIRWNKKSGEYQQYTDSKGLSNDVLYSIYEDKRGFLWISTDYGLARFDVKTEIFMVYLEEDGISHHEFNRVSHFQSADGTLYYGTINGVTSFHPLRLIPENQTDIPLIASKVTKSNSINKIEDLTHQLTLDGQLVLKPNENLLQMEFSLLDYLHSNDVQYYYRILGFQEEWIPFQGNELIISGLPFGDLNLEVKAKNRNGIFSKNIFQLPIQVLKPRYKQTWFKIFIGLFLATGLVSFYFFRLYGLERRKIELENLVKKRTEKIKEDKILIEQQAAELKRLDYLKSKFFVNIAHEIRTPLTLLFGPITSVLQSKDLSNRNFSLLATARNNLEKILGLIEEIMDLSKLEEGKLPLQKEPFELNDLLFELATSFSVLAETRGIDFSFDKESDAAIALLSDREKIEKIISNYLSNALKFTPKGGEVKLKLKSDAENVLIEVSDTGPGIGEDDLDRVFERYYQTDNAYADSQEGTGIGLAICKEYASLLEAKVSVKNNSDEGSTFALFLPAELVLNTTEQEKMKAKKAGALPDDFPENTGAAKAALQLNLDNKSIFLAEDNEELSVYIESLLKEKGAKVSCFNNGQMLLEQLQQLETNELPNLIITDIMMPVMDGLELIQNLKAQKEFRLIPIIVLTAKVGEQQKLEVLSIGVDDYLIKPFSNDELLSRSRNLISNALERANARQYLEGASSNSLNEASELSPNSDWLEKVRLVIQENLSAFDFSVEKLAELIGISRRQLYRKLKRVSGLTPNDFIQEIRLQKARSLLEQQAFSTVKAVALEVGVKDVVNFSRNYKKRFGKLPSEYF